MLHLQDHRLEHRHRIKRRAASLGAIAISQALDQPAPEILKVDRSIEDLKRIPVLAQLHKLLSKAEKTAGIHYYTSVQSVNHIAANPAMVNAGVQLVWTWLNSQGLQPLTEKTYSQV
jgi:hypothetical protein